MELDNRTKSDIIREIAQKARSYTPEWRFDEHDPDIGSAIALQYADMLYGTVSRFNKVPLKNKISFMNTLDASLLPAVPSNGYVQFTMTDEDMSSQEVDARTVLLAEDENAEGGNIRFETEEDIVVTPAQLMDIYQTDDESDSIYYKYNKNDPKEITFFSKEGENLQEHTFYFSQSTVLDLRGTAQIILHFMQDKGVMIRPEQLQLLANPAYVEITYWNGSGFSEFSQVQVIPDGLLLEKSAQSPDFVKADLKEIQGIEEGIEESANYYIRMKVRDMSHFMNFGYSSLSVSAREYNIIPEIIYGDNTECSTDQCMPFGEHPTVYQEAYFGSTEAFGKAGAHVELSFGMQLKRIPLETNIDPENQMEWVIKKKDYKPLPEYEISITKVVWEYYNGDGWSRLFMSDEYSDLFQAGSGSNIQYKTIFFDCPSDIQPVLINAVETYYIRIRILKMNNQYKTQGWFIVPELSNIELMFDYRQAGRQENRMLMVDSMYKKNNLQLKKITGKDVDAGKEASLIYPFEKSGNDKRTMYLGFSSSPAGNPIRILFTVNKMQESANGAILYEYYDGGKWRTINTLDETAGLARSGIVSWNIGSTICRSTLFGKNRFWIRAIDVSRYYSSDLTGKKCPLVTGMYMNTTKAVNIDERQTEYFQMEYYKKNKQFCLLKNNVISIEVYVDETTHITEEETEALQQAKKAVVERDEFGVIERVWVKWDYVESFIDSKGTDRQFVLNATDGIVTFGDGRRGRIPDTSMEDNIRIEYQCGGGRITNVAPDQITAIERSIGFVSGVTNPLAFSGGCDIEIVSEAVKRNSSMIRNQGRAITLQDFEGIVPLVDREIVRVKAFQGMNGTGELESGALTLIVLLEEKKYNVERFDRIKREIQRYLRDKVSGMLLGSGRLYITQPQFVIFDVYTEVEVKQFKDVFHVKREIMARINECFENEDMQRGIGQYPNAMQIQTVVSDVDEDFKVRKIVISAYIQCEEGLREIPVETLESYPYIYPVNGTHEVVVLVE